MPIAVTIEFDREDEIDGYDLENDQGETCVHDGARHRAFAFVVDALDFCVHFVGRFGDQKQSADDQDQVVPGEGAPQHRKERLGQADQPGQGEQKKDTEDERQAEPDLARPRHVGRGEPRHDNGDEYDIVDAEHDFQRAQGDECSPGVRIGEKIEHVGIGL